MTLMDALEKQLQKEIDDKATPPKQEETVNTQVLYEQLLDKKMKEMEKMFSDKMNNLIASMQKKETTSTEDVEEKGQTDDSTTDVSVT